jgi:hypothetical protein
MSIVGEKSRYRKLSQLEILYDNVCSRQQSGKRVLTAVHLLAMKRSFAFALLALSLTCICSRDVLAKCVTEEKRPVYQLSRVLIGKEGRPIIDAEVRVFDGNHNVLLTVKSDGVGAYSIDAVKPGTYHVHIYAVGYIEHEYTLVIRDKVPKPKRSEVRLRPGSECHDMMILEDSER